MAFRLIPREEKFYTDFQALATELKRGARLLEEMLLPERPIWDKADEIKEVEHKCDFLTHEIIQRLNRTFVTPLDREDLHALARSLDDVMDAIDASATLGWSHYEVSFSGTNLVGQQYRLGEYNFASDFHTQGGATLVPVRHFTAGAPRALFVTFAVNFGGG